MIKKEKGANITHIRNETGFTTVDPTDITSIIREYYKHFDTTNLRI